jgi:hypothetical protein
VQKALVILLLFLAAPILFILSIPSGKFLRCDYTT